MKMLIIAFAAGLMFPLAARSDDTGGPDNGSRLGGTWVCKCI